MKKILSIFSISAILGSGTILSGGGIACGSKPKPKPKPPKTIKYNLKHLNFYDLNGLQQADKSRIVIVGKTIYPEVENQIITQYNNFFKADKKIKPLKLSDFIADSTTPTKTQTWAIEIENGKKDIIHNTTTATNLNINTNTNLVNTNNSLDVIITTTNQNVITPTTSTATTFTWTADAYLDHFVFNNKDANNNHDLVISEAKPQPEFTTKSVIDFSKGEFALDHLAISGTNTVSQLLISIESSHTNELKLTNAVITNLNNSRDQHILDKNLKTLIPKLPTLDAGTSPYVIKNNPEPGSVQILNIYIRQHQDQTKGEPTYKFKYEDGGHELAFAHQTADVYMQIKIGNWNYLSSGSNKFITPANTCVYAFLGEAHHA